ncbi:phospholipase/Carboxylesterase superfamily protein [Patellaria atrata CBS 101060]|uniref:Phospholipase/Carboxylesterase superfamily protein n=1 Tax=Patellaria atrata CBS 101060 TaxID=1346257 RepID=A0A9P4SE83_9PEZI|nr:phospholipase/Carboxylesterase superfamily protein [Patellaria atrata CBS 101060]
MLPRVPTSRDFPSAVQATIISPPQSHPATNILVLLHGLGDTNDAFTALGRQMNLPETLCISLRAPTPLPFDLGGFHWGDDLIFDQSTGEMEVDTGFISSTELLARNLVHDVLMEKCGYRLRDIILFGYGQGAILALGTAVELRKNEFGGVIAIGGILPHTSPPSLTPKCKTPVMICKGMRNSAVTPAEKERLKSSFEFVDIKEWKKNADGMPSSRDEMLPIMQFLSRRLRSIREVPQGSIELGL